jgi:hypothetical protein
MQSRSSWLWEISGYPEPSLLESGLSDSAQRDIKMLGEFDVLSQNRANILEIPESAVPWAFDTPNSRKTLESNVLMLLWSGKHQGGDDQLGNTHTVARFLELNETLVGLRLYHVASIVFNLWHKYRPDRDASISQHRCDSSCGFIVSRNREAGLILETFDEAALYNQLIQNLVVPRPFVW